MAKADKDAVLKRVLKKILPKKSEAKKLESLANSVLSIVNDLSSEYGAYAIIAGSLTRNTWLPGKEEFDIFILFPESTEDEKMEKAGLEIGKAAVKKLNGKFVIEYAEHPYVSGVVNGMHMDIVPCFEIESTDKLKSAVDRTPFHVRYTEKNLPFELSNEVRLLKKFCKSQGIYGADAKVEGFSGYVCEVLTIRYGSFVDVLKAASGWVTGEIIDVENHYRKEDYEGLKTRYRKEPLILIDPTDARRNAAAAVSPSSFQKLRWASRVFLENPSESMFFSKERKPLKLSELKTLQKNRESEMIAVSFVPPKVVPDILWPQLRRFGQRMEAILKENEFHVLRKDVYTSCKGLAVLFMEMESSRLPSVRKHVGPSVFDEDGSKSFLKKYKSRALNGPYVEGEFWVVELSREHRTAEGKIKDSLKDSEKILRAKGIPSHIAKQISKKFSVTSDLSKIMKMGKKDKGFGVFLREYFDKVSVA